MSIFKSKSKKILPLTEPPVMGYLHHAYMLSIIGKSASFEDWFHSSYIQIYNDYLTGGLNFYEHDFTRFQQPLLSHHSMCIDAFKKGSYDIVEFAKNGMDTDYYFYTFVDEKYIPGKTAYKLKQSFPHEVLLHGYDEATSLFQAVGFSDKFQYEKFTISYEDFAQGFNHLKMTAKYMNNIHLLKPSEAEYPFRLKQVTGLLEDYYLSRNTSEQYSMVRTPFQSAFGMAVYDFLIEYFEKVMKGKAQLTVNSLHILWEHKKCMMSRVQYMQKKYSMLLDYDIAPLKEVERLAYKTRDELIVFSMTNDPKCFQNIIKYLNQLKEKEKIAIGQLLDRISAITV
jgi:hypothetical protein